MVNLQGTSLPDDADQDEAIPDAIDTELLQERTGGDKAFVEQLQETLRPLYVPSFICTILLNPGPAPDSDVMSEHGGIASLASIKAGGPLSMAWQMDTLVGSMEMTLGSIQLKQNLHPHNPHNLHLP